MPQPWLGRCWKSPTESWSLRAPRCGRLVSARLLHRGRDRDHPAARRHLQLGADVDDDRRVAHLLVAVAARSSAACRSSATGRRAPQPVPVNVCVVVAAQPVEEEAPAPPAQQSSASVAVSATSRRPTRRAASGSTSVVGRVMRAPSRRRRPTTALCGATSRSRRWPVSTGIRDLDEALAARDHDRPARSAAPPARPRVDAFELRRSSAVACGTQRRVPVVRRSRCRSSHAARTPSATVCRAAGAPGLGVIGGGGTGAVSTTPSSTDRGSTVELRL